MTTLQWLASIAVIAFAFPGSEHPDAASLGGKVTDENLAAIPSATISARNLFSGEVATVTSNAAGLYKFTGLRQGRYSVFGRAEGYGCTSVFNVLLVRGEYTELNLMLATSRKKTRAADCPETAAAVPGALLSF